MPIRFDLRKCPVSLFSKRLAHIRYIQFIQHDLRDAAAINPEFRRLESKIQYLNQTYIVQLVASWQVFIEQLVEYGFELLEKNEGSGHFRAIARAKLDEAKKRFNTPNRENIDRLFKETLNIDNISDSWEWEGVSRDKATSTLASVLLARHQIAHTGTTKLPLSYESNFEQMNILFRIAGATENALREQLTARPIEE